MNDLWKAYAYLYPAARPGIDYVIQDDNLGGGPYLAEWKLPGEPPAEAEIVAAIAAYDAEQQKAGTKRGRQDTDAAGAIGKPVSALKQAEKDTLLEQILERMGAVDADRNIRPLNQW